jgi:heme iron utilization protein
MQQQPSEAELARQLLATIKTAALASLAPSGAPFASYVTIAPDRDLSPILLLSRLAVHTGNIVADPRASLLIVRTPDADVRQMTAERLTLVGSLALAPSQEDSRHRFLSAHPDAAGYAAFSDFAFYRFAIESGHLVAGFGRIVDLQAHQLRLGQPDAV